MTQQQRDQDQQAQEPGSQGSQGESQRNPQPPRPEDIPRETAQDDRNKYSGGRAGNT